MNHEHVGWVECNGTHRLPDRAGRMMGYASLHPSYKLPEPKVSGPNFRHSGVYALEGEGRSPGKFPPMAAIMAF